MKDVLVSSFWNLIFDNKANEKRWAEEASTWIDSHKGMPNGKIQSNVIQAAKRGRASINKWNQAI